MICDFVFFKRLFVSRLKKPVSRSIALCHPHCETAMNPRGTAFDFSYSKKIYIILDHIGTLWKEIEVRYPNLQIYQSINKCIII